MASCDQWLRKSANEFLERLNSMLEAAAQLQSPNPQKEASTPNRLTAIEVRIFIFYRGQVLLKRLDDTAWTVPSFRTDLTSPTVEDDYKLLFRTVLHLKDANIPIDILQELQFMDFSHKEPLCRKAGSTNPLNPGEIILSILLTTSNCAIEHGVASHFLHEVDPDVELRWVAPEDFSTIALPTDSESPEKPLISTDLVKAYERLTLSYRPNLISNGQHDRFYVLGGMIIWSVLMTRRLLEVPNDMGYGLVVLNTTLKQKFIELYPVALERWQNATCGMQFAEGYNSHLVIARWDSHGTLNFLKEVPSRVWILVLDLMGRIREGFGFEDE